MRYVVNKTDRFDKWLRKLKDIRAKIMIARRIDRLKDGYFGDFKSLGDELFELRIFTGSGYRIYFVHVGEELIVLLVGGDKSTQQRDIKLAKKIAQEFT
jgi:putative addiction module killer protein